MLAPDDVTMITISLLMLELAINNFYVALIIMLILNVVKLAIDKQYCSYVCALRKRQGIIITCALEVLIAN